MGVQAGAAIDRSRASRGALTASPSIDPWTAEFADSGAGHAGGCPEIDCVRSLLAAEVIDDAEHRAAALGVGADRVLIAAGRLSGDLYLLVAPRGAAARRILRLIEENPARARRFRFTSAERLNRFVLRYGDKVIAARAAGELKQKWPMLSAGPPRWLGNIVPFAIVGLLSFAAVVLAPALATLAFEVMLAALFLAWLGLRLTGAFIDPTACDPARRLTDESLPAIERLDYPAEKLDVIIAVEADDRETRAAIAARNNRMPVVVIPVPTQGPRTKPKALNVALPFARGTFTVIYDAEDRPEPNQ